MKAALQRNFKRVKYRNKEYLEIITRKKECLNVYHFKPHCPDIFKFKTQQIKLTKMAVDEFITSNLYEICSSKANMQTTL